MSPPPFVPARILVDLLNLNVAPLAVYQMLKAMCAGQRLASEPQDPLPTSGLPETRGQSWGSGSLAQAAAAAGLTGEEG